jgi:hypothetical protein
VLIETVNRPTYKELDSKINEAKNAVTKGAVNLINPEAVASDAIQLGYLLETELPDVLLSVLSNTKPDHYAGKRPPSRSYENKIIMSELFAFRTRSERFQCKIYLKFTLFDEELFLISLHKNRNKGD